MKTKVKRFSVVVSAVDDYDIPFHHVGEPVAENKQGRWYGAGMDFDRVYDTFPNTPPVPYRVTYTLDPNSRLKVTDEFGMPALVKRVNGVDKSNFGHPKGFFACFLPMEWKGRRVRRTVKRVTK